MNFPKFALGTANLDAANGINNQEEYKGEATRGVITHALASGIFAFNTAAEYRKAEELKNFFMREMFQRGVLIPNTHNVLLALGKKDFKVVMSAYSATFQALSRAIGQKNLREQLLGNPLTPLFKVCQV